ncbi:hypothetical protein OCS_00948 [Ophiocordyceps sinensis CO18]|uniref:Uncharacterized protein n=1 Tax=Ophiocordyceps sinensis (strain Co18 / CGMCC 3.14243) TaxID=911162 RepID=T5ANL0_OPHSC|nr:hypothetical protein OCS_00948 [Ophiocordyceps sinensis CO18]
MDTIHQATDMSNGHAPVPRSLLPRRPFYQHAVNTMYWSNCVTRNALPGDTKLSKKWWPSMKNDGPLQLKQWRTVVGQVVTYMAYHKTRYGFILTDRCLVVLRLTRLRETPGRAATPHKRAAAGPVRLPSDESTEEDDEDDKTFHDDDALYWDYENPEFAVVA